MFKPQPEVCYMLGAGCRTATREWYTLDEIRQRLVEAAYTLRRLPIPKNGRPHDFKVSWPDVAYDWLAYGWLPARAPRIPPSPADISRLDECLNWLHWLTRDQRLIVWARANKWSWRKIEALDELERDGHGRTERWLRTIAGDGEARILAELNGTPRRMVISLSNKTASVQSGARIRAESGTVSTK